MCIANKGWNLKLEYSWVFLRIVYKIYYSKY